KLPPIVRARANPGGNPIPRNRRPGPAYARRSCRRVWAPGGGRRGGHRLLSPQRDPEAARRGTGSRGSPDQGGKARSMAVRPARFQAHGMNLYLDDDCAKASLVKLLKKAGHQVAIPADAGLTGASDPRHLMHTVQNNRVLLTKNHDDFE